jgi:hypothetical protein
MTAFYCLPTTILEIGAIMGETVTAVNSTMPRNDIMKTSSPLHTYLILLPQPQPSPDSSQIPAYSKSSTLDYYYYYYFYLNQIRMKKDTSPSHTHLDINFTNTLSSLLYSK